MGGLYDGREGYLFDASFLIRVGYVVYIILCVVCDSCIGLFCGCGRVGAAC